MTTASHKTLFFLCILILNSLLLPSQSLKFSKLTSEEGLADDYVETVLMDSEGFLWAGTHDGLSKWNGFEFKNYKHIKGDSTSLQSNFITALHEDYDNNIWVGTQYGALARYDKEKDIFKTYWFGEGNNGKLSNNIVWGIAGAKDGKLWLACEQGLCLYDYKTGKEIWYRNEYKDPLSISENICLHVAVAPNGETWVAHHNTHIIDIISPNRDSIRQVSFKTETASVIGVRSLAFDKDSTAWIGTRTSGLFTLPYDKKRPTKVTTDVKAQGSIGMKNIWSIYPFEDKVYIGTINGGLYIYDLNNKEYSNHIISNSDEYSIHSRSISGITTDSFGNVYFATHGGGISILQPSNNIFKHYASTSEPTSLGHKFVSGFLEDSEGNFWVSTDGGGINLFLPETKTFKRITTDNGLTSNAILNPVEGLDGKIWLSTWGGGINIINKDGTFSHDLNKDPNDPNSLTHDDLKFITFIDSLFYFGTHGQGLNIYNPKTKQFNNKNHQPAGFQMDTARDISKIIKDSKGRLWIGSTRGIYKIIGDSVTAYIHEDENSASLSSNIVTDVYEDSNGKIWVGTFSGLDFYDEQQKAFIKSSYVALAQLNIKALIEDNNNNLWISTNEGIFTFPIDGGVIRQYTKAEGLQGDQFFERAIYKLQDGTIAAGGLNGYNIFDPTLLEPDTSTPVSHFNNLWILSKLQHTTINNSIITNAVDLAEEITLKHTQHSFSIDFFASHSFSPARTKFAYMLEGFDKDWKYTEKIRKANYTNLDYGVYTFKLKAANSEGKWGEEKTLKIEILPAWWQTVWFRVVIVLSIIVSLYIFFRLRIRSIRHQNLKLEHLVKKRTEELEAAYIDLKMHSMKIEEQHSEISKQQKLLMHKNDELRNLNATKDKFFSIIAHDLKNPLNSVIGFSDLLTIKKDYDTEKKERMYKIINRSAKNVFTLLENLLHWARSQTKTIKVNAETHSLELIINETVNLISEAALKKDIDIQLDIPTDDIKVFVDYNMISTVIRNLTTNAIKFTPENGKIIISAENSEAGYASIQVIDTGIGISQDKIEKLFKIEHKTSTVGTNNEEGTGLGLIICKEFIELNKGSIDVYSNEGKGSIFSFTVPISKN